MLAYNCDEPVSTVTCPGSRRRLPMSLKDAHACSTLASLPRRRAEDTTHPITCNTLIELLIKFRSCMHACPGRASRQAGSDRISKDDMQADKIAAPFVAALQQKIKKVFYLNMRLSCLIARGGTSVWRNTLHQCNCSKSPCALLSRTGQGCIQSALANISATVPLSGQAVRVNDSSRLACGCMHDPSID